MKYLTYICIFGALLLTGCSQRAENKGKVEPYKIQKISYESQILASPIFTLTGEVYSGTKYIKISRENSGAQKEYNLQYSPTESIFLEDFRLDKGNIGYGENKYIISFQDKDKTIAEGKLTLDTYYQEIKIGSYTIYFDEKGVRNCGPNCRISLYYETPNREELKDKDIIGTGKRYEAKKFSSHDIMPYEGNIILFKKDTTFMISTGYLVYNQKQKQFFQAKNIYSKESDDRLLFGDLYLNGKLLIKDFPVQYRDTGGGSIIPIIYEPNKNLISTKWQDGDGCGYIKGTARYSLSNGKQILFSEIDSSQGLKVTKNDNTLSIIYTQNDSDEISLIAKYLVGNKIIQTETLINKVKKMYYDETNPCEQILEYNINEVNNQISVKRLKTVGGESQEFIRSIDSGDNIIRTQ